MLCILEEIDRICTKYNIKWWIEDGTLLGALRHQGFIPWDDDCDIGMMREDYEKFVKVADVDLNKRFMLQTKQTEPKYPWNFTKVRMKETKLIKKDESDDEPYFQGVYVDIFIWDYFYGFERSIGSLLNIIPSIRNGRTEYPKHSLKRIMHGIMTAIPYAFNKILVIVYLAFRYNVRKNNKLPFVRPQIFSDGWGGWWYCKDVVFPLKHELLFEGHKFPVPNNYDEYLRIMYGNYMQLPPLEDRVADSVLIEVPIEYVK